MRCFKKSFCFVLALLFIFSVTVNTVFAEEYQETVKVVLDGRQLSFDVQPVLIQSRTLVPMRAIFEALGAEIQWDGKTGTVTAAKEDISSLTTVKLQVGSKDAVVTRKYSENKSTSSKTIKLDVPSIIIDNRTMVPARFVAETLGAKVDWDPGSRTVYIKSLENVITGIIREALEDSSEKINLPANDSMNSKIVLYFAEKVLKSNAELNYVDNYLFYTYSKNGETYNELKFNYFYTRDRVVQMKMEADNKAEEIVKSLIQPDMTEFEKELVLHDYIVTHTKYDYDNVQNGTIPNESYTAYGVLVKGTGVCQGYSAAINLLMGKVGIESACITGSAGGINHAWNIVKIDEKYYHLDATWDDPVPDGGDKVYYSYFNLTDKQIALNHSWDSNESYPVCDSTESNYFYKNNMVVKNYEDFYNILNSSVKQKKEKVVMKIIDYDEKTYDLYDTLSKINNDNAGLDYYVSRWGYSVDRNMSIIFIQDIEYTNR